MVPLSTSATRKNAEANIGVLVRAFARMKTDHALVLAGGKGWLYDAIFAEVRALGLEERVLFPLIENEAKGGPPMPRLSMRPSRILDGV